MLVGVEDSGGEGERVTSHSGVGEYEAHSDYVADCQCSQVVDVGVGVCANRPGAGHVS